MLKALKMVLGIVLLLCASPSFAESVDTAWVRMYNGPGNNEDHASAIEVDGSGNVYVTGYGKGSGTDYDYATIKYYSNGDTAWVRRYNGPGNIDDAAYGLSVDGSDNVYVTGASYGLGTSYDYATIRYFPNGDVAWVQRYNGPANSDDDAIAIAVDDSSYVYVTGSSKVSETDWDYATIKYYPNGDTVWVRRYNGPGNSYDNASALAVDDSGYVYVTGYSEGSGTRYDYTTIKYTPGGDTVWVRRYNGPGNSDDYPNAIAIDGSKDVYVCGYSYGDVTEDDYAVIKYYPNGDTAWVRRYNGLYNSTDNAYAMVLDHSDNIYVTGSSYTGDDNTDYATIKYNSEGDSLWARLYEGPGNSDDVARAIAVDDSDNIYVTGGSYGGIGTDNDFATIKYHPNGDTAWIIRYNSPANNSDAASAIAVDDSGNVYVTGTSYNALTYTDYTTIKYVKKPSAVKDEAESSGSPSEFTLSQNYPNPFNPSTTIHYTVHRPQSTARSPVPTTLRIYNVLGEVVRTLVNENKHPGSYSVQWDGKNDKGERSVSGVYFYQLKVGDQILANKMVLLK
ncbi:MAG: SBBP repeat-containing protein [Candidatus Zixiibacteriota bacterium]